jgi:hypothetical protein
MSGQEPEDRANQDQTKITERETISAPEPDRTEQIETERPAPTRFFEVPVEATSSAAEPTEPADRIDWTDPPAMLEPPTPVHPAEPVEATAAEPNPLDLPAAPVSTPEPAFRPENESTDPDPGFVGYITKKRGPEVPSSSDSGSPQPEFVPGGHPQTSFGGPVMTRPETEPGIRTRTVIIGLILLAIGISALVAQLGGVGLDPVAVALTVMLAAGVTLISAAIKRSKTRS